MIQTAIESSAQGDRSNGPNHAKVFAAHHSIDCVLEHLQRKGDTRPREESCTEAARKGIKTPGFQGDAKANHSLCMQPAELAKSSARRLCDVETS